MVNVERDSLRGILKDVSEEIKRVMAENDLTQEDLCRITNMSQSNISKIQNCKVVPRIETLQKIAEATHTKLIISFESTEGDD
jgi:transcriptional regulator with XRE-family HTH domain